MAIKVLVVDDSALMRMLLSDMLSGVEGIEVVDRAANGRQALEKAKSLKPDVITMDIQMPEMNGVEAVKAIMAANPTRIIMVTGVTDPEVTLEALKMGALDIVTKPSGTYSVDIDKVRDELVRKIKMAVDVQLSKVSRKLEAEVPSAADVIAGAKAVVAIGASTGGPPALESILSVLPANLAAPVLIVQHLPFGFTKALAMRMNANSRVSIKEAADGDRLEPGKVYIAPGNRHMLVERDSKGLGNVVHLDDSAPVRGLRPTVDRMMESVAAVYGQNSLGVILTGMGRDGADGLKAIKKKGGSTVAQDEDTSVVYGMPKAAARTGCVDKVLPLHRIPSEIVRQIGLKQTGRK